MLLYKYSYRIGLTAIHLFLSSGFKNQQEMLLEHNPSSNSYNSRFCNPLSILNSNVKNISISLFLFFLAGLCEIGGGYLVWLWLRVM